MESYLEKFLSMSDEDKLKIFEAYKRSFYSSRFYECQVSVGKGCKSRFKWVSSCELTDQAIIVHLSDDRCFIKDNIGDSLCDLLSFSDSHNWSVSSVLVREEVSGDA